MKKDREDAVVTVYRGGAKGPPAVSRMTVRALRQKLDRAAAAAALKAACREKGAFKPETGR